MKKLQVIAALAAVWMMSAPLSAFAASSSTSVAHATTHHQVAKHATAKSTNKAKKSSAHATAKKTTSVKRGKASHHATSVKKCMLHIK